MISAAIETAISSGVRLLICKPIGVRILFKLFFIETFFFEISQKRFHLRLASENAEIFEIFIE